MFVWVLFVNSFIHLGELVKLCSPLFEEFKFLLVFIVLLIVLDFTKIINIRVVTLIAVDMDLINGKVNLMKKYGKILLQAL